MHEFLLFGHVANNERQRLLQQLAGVTRMQPKHVAERHLLFKARPPVGLGNIPSAGGSQGVLSAEIQRTKQMLTSSIFYIQLVCTLEEEKAPVEDHSHSNGVLNGYATLEEAKANGARSDHCENKGGKWAIEFRDIPDPGKQPVTTRLMSRTQVEGHDMFAFVKNLGFEYVSQYVLEGHKFYDQDITLFLHQVLQVPQASNEQAAVAGFQMSSIGELQPLDSTEKFILQVSLEALDGNNPEIKEKAAQQLIAMKETLKQAVALTPGDRLALDTKVPMRNRP